MADEQVARSVAVAFRPDGKAVAFAASKDIKVYDPDTGNVLATLTNHSVPVTTLAYSPDGKVLASGSLDATVRIWDPAASKQLSVLQGHQKRVVAVTFSPDGKLVASIGGDGIVRVLVHAEGKLLLSKQYYTNNTSGLGLSYAPDGKTFAHCGGGAAAHRDRAAIRRQSATDDRQRSALPQREAEQRDLHRLQSGRQASGHRRPRQGRAHLGRGGPGGPRLPRSRR